MLRQPSTGTNFWADPTSRTSARLQTAGPIVGGIVLVLVVVLVLFAVSGLGGVDRGATPSSGAGQPRLATCGTTKADPTYEADRIVNKSLSTLYPVARRVYEAVLDNASGEVQSCAAQGLAKLTVLEKAAANATAAERSWAEKAGSEFQDLQKTLVAGWGILLTGFAATLIVLLVVARRVPRWFVRPATQARPRVRALLWGVGVALLVAASVTPILIATTTVSGTSGWWVAAPLLGTVVLMSIALASCRRAERGFVALTVTTAAAGLAAIILMLTPLTAPPGTVINPLVIFGIAAGVVGVAWVAFARGTALRAELLVKGADGSADASGSELLLVRLSELGTQKPSGITTGGASDVSTLPEEAVTTLPTGTWATLLFNLLRVIRPTPPWLITVTFPAADCVTWSIARNGVMVGESERLVTSAELLPAEPTAAETSESETAVEKPEDPRKDELLTACAGDVLLTLSETHQVLGAGLCGADDGRALALYAVGVRQSSDVRRRKALLLAAIDVSPRYALARLAYLHTLNEDEPGERATFAEKLCELEGRKLHVDEDGQTVLTGYEAYALRLNYSLAVAWLNVRKDYENAAKMTDEASISAQAAQAAQAAAKKADALTLREKYETSRAEATSRAATAAGEAAQSARGSGAAQLIARATEAEQEATAAARRLDDAKSANRKAQDDAASAKAEAKIAAEAARAADPWTNAARAAIALAHLLASPPRAATRISMSCDTR